MKVVGAQIFESVDYNPARAARGDKYLVYIEELSANKLRKKGAEVLCDSDGSNYIFCKAFDSRTIDTIESGKSYDVRIDVIEDGKYVYLKNLGVVKNYKDTWADDWKAEWDKTIESIKKKAKNVNLSLIPITCTLDRVAKKTLL